MATKVLGTVALIPKGVWASGTYNKNEYVYHTTLNASYVALHDGVTSEPSGYVDTADWHILCRGIGVTTDNNFTDAAKAKVDSAILNSQTNIANGYVGIGSDGKINNSEFISVRDRIVSVKDYGAKGDGVTDDSNSIQLAVNAVMQSGGILDFPHGVYNISTPINFTPQSILQSYSNVVTTLANTVVVGATSITTNNKLQKDWLIYIGGTNPEVVRTTTTPSGTVAPYSINVTSIKNTHNLNDPVISFTSNFLFTDVITIKIIGSGQVKLFATATMDEIFNFTYNSNGVSPYFSTIDGIDFEGNDLAVSGIVYDYSIHMTCKNCKFTELQNGLWCGGKDGLGGYGAGQIIYNTFRTQTAIMLECAGDNLIQHNDIFVQNVGIHVCGYSGDCSITDNVMQRDNPISSAIVIGVLLDGQFNTSRDISNVTIKNNEFVAFTYDIQGLGAATDNYNIHHIIINANHHIPLMADAAHINGYSYNSSFVNIKWCDAISITDNDIGKIGITETLNNNNNNNQIILISCTNGIVSTNRFFNSYIGAFVLDQCGDFNIFENLFTDCCQIGGGYSILTLTNTHNCIIKNNKFISFQQYSYIGIAEDSNCNYNFAESNIFSSFISTPYIVHGVNSRFVSNIYGNAIPTTGTWTTGSTLMIQAPSSGNYIGYICTVAGSPGTWKGFGLIQ